MRDTHRICPPHLRGREVGRSYHGEANAKPLSDIVNELFDSIGGQFPDGMPLIERMAVLRPDMVEPNPMLADLVFEQVENKPYVYYRTPQWAVDAVFGDLRIGKITPREPLFADARHERSGYAVGGPVTKHPFATDKLFKAHGTVTGRTSCTEPNLEAKPSYAPAVMAEDQQDSGQISRRVSWPGAPLSQVPKRDARVIARAVQNCKTVEQALDYGEYAHKLSLKLGRSLEEADIKYVLSLSHTALLERLVNYRNQFMAQTPSDKPFRCMETLTGALKDGASYADAIELATEAAKQGRVLKYEDADAQEFQREADVSAECERQFFIPFMSPIVPLARNPGITREQFDRAVEALWSEIEYQNNLPRRTADEAKDTAGFATLGRAYLSKLEDHWASKPGEVQPEGNVAVPDCLHDLRKLGAIFVRAMITCGIRPRS